MIKWVMTRIAVLIVLVFILSFVGLLFVSVHYSAPYDEWVKQENEREKKEKGSNGDGKR